MAWNKVARSLQFYILEGVILIILLLGLRQSGQTTTLQFMPQRTQEGALTGYVSTRFMLSPGIYHLALSYETDGDMMHLVDIFPSDPVGDVAKADVRGAFHRSIETNTTILYAGQNVTDYEFRVRRNITEGVITVTYGGSGQLEVKEAVITKTNLLQRKNIVCFLVCMVIAHGVIYLIQKKNPHMTKTVTILGLIIMGCSLPLCTDYMLTGADMTFHLLRIEGVKDGLLAGQFPVRIHPNWLQGHGYGAGIFYCDLFLYIPAVLRIMGFSVQEAYKFYKLIVNISTCLIAYYSFRSMLKEDRLALVGSFLYSFQMVRLVYLYSVDGVGQYTAMTFLPLVLCGLYDIYQGDGKDRGADNRPTEGKGWICLCLGMTGILSSHVLTTLMTGICMLLGCVILWKRTLTPRVLKELGKAALGTLLLCAWYVVPFLDYMLTMDLAVTKGGAAVKQIQTWGMYIAQVFEPFPLGGQSGAMVGGQGMAGETIYGIGLGLDIACLFVLYYLSRKKEKHRKTVMLFFGLGILSLYMATLHFPWDRLAKLGGLCRQLIATLQFPYRMTTISGICIILALLLAMDDSHADRQNILEKSVLIMTLLGTLLSAWFFMDGCLNQSTGHFRIYDETCMGNGYISGGEYLLLGTNTESLTYKEPVIKDGNLEMPLLYYKGYEAVMDSGESLPVICGDNNLLTVQLPDDYRGEGKDVTVRFQGFWYWRVSEIISFLAMLAIFSLARKRPRGILMADRETIKFKGVHVNRDVK